MDELCTGMAGHKVFHLWVQCLNCVQSLSKYEKLIVIIWLILMKSETKVIGRISIYLFEHKFLFFLTLFLAFVMTVLSVLVPSAIQKVLDQIFMEGIENLSNFYLGIVLIGSLFLAKEIFNCFRIRVNNKLEQKVILKIRKCEISLFFFS